MKYFDRRYLVAWLLFVAFLNGPFSTFAKKKQVAFAPSEEHVLNSLGLQFPDGRAFPTDFPVLFEELNRNYQRMGKELATYSRDYPIIDPNFEAKLVFVNGDSVNAFAAVIKDPKSGLITKQVTIVTTGLLGEFLHNPESNLAVGERLSALYGVFAHEFAHTIDKADPEGIEQKHMVERDSTGAKIAIELRTDSEAQRLLAKAGIPNASLYSSLELISGSPDLLRRMSSMISTHPETNFRKAFHRSVLTVERVERGLAEATPIAKINIKRILQESSKFYRQFEFPRNVSELNKMLDDVRTDAEFNALVLWFDLHLEEQEDVDIGDNTLNLIRRKIMSSTKKLCDSRKCLKKLLKRSKLPGVANMEKRHHAEFLEKLDFYKSKELLKNNSQEITRKVAPNAAGTKVFTTSKNTLQGKLRPRRRSNAGLGAIRHTALLAGTTHDLSRGFSRNIIYAHLKNEYNQSKDIERLEGTLAYMVGQPDVLNGRNSFPAKDFVLFNTMFHKIVIRAFADQTGVLKAGSSPQNKRRSNEFYDFSYAVPTQKNRRYWQTLLNRNATQEVRQRTKEMVLEIWKNRGVWAYWEFFSEEDFRLDWEFVAEVVGIPRDQINQNIQKSFKRYMKRRIDEASHVDTKDVRFRRPGASGTRPNWLHAHLDQFFKRAIDSRPAVLRDDLAVSILARHYGFYPEKREKALVQAFSVIVSKQPPTSTDEIYRMWDQAVGDAMGGKRRSPEDLERSDFPIILSVLNKNEVSQRVKKEFLLASFESNRFSHLRGLTKSDMESIYADFLSMEVVNDVPEFLKKVKTQQLKRWSAKNSTIIPTGYTGYSETTVRRVAARLAGTLNKELASLKRMPDVEFLSYVSRFGEVIGFAFNQNEFSQANNASLRFIEELRKRDLSTEERLKSFLSLTEFVATESTDQYFREEILPKLEYAKHSPRMREFLKQNRFSGAKLEIKMVKWTLGRNAKKLAANDLLKDLDTLAPSRSNEKDTFLEDIAWERSLSGSELKKLIEKRKTTNWRAHKPDLLISNGWVTEFLNALSPNDKADLVDYLIAGAEAEPKLERLLEKARRYSESGQFDGVIAAIANPYDQKNNELIDETLTKIRTNIVTFVSSTEPEQRVPAVEFVLTTGDKNVLSDSYLSRKLVERHLQIKPNSPEHAFLNAYMDAVPQHERDLVLSYMLLQREPDGDKRMDIRTMCETFGLLGIKFGQLAALWNIFGDEYSEQLKELFGDAKPMSMWEIESTLKREMGDAEYESKIRRLISVRSASVKNVVFAELQNGKELALMVKRPFVERQTTTNIKIAKRFLERLKHYSITTSNPLFEPLVESIEEQMPSELDFKNETAALKELKRLIKQDSPSMRNFLGDWNLEVPSVSDEIQASSDLYATEILTGVSANDFFDNKNISMAKKEHVGKILTKVSLRMFFEHGIFDPDRHPGNWIIDAKNKTIHFIDPGQLVRFPSKKSAFKADDRLAIAKFIHAISTRNGRKIVTAALALQKKTKNNSVDLDAAAKDIQRIDRGLDLENFLQDAVTALYGSKIMLEGKYTFGMLKGLLVLTGAKYVPAKEMKKIVSREVLKLYAKKAPAVFAPRLSFKLDSMLKKAGFGRKNSAKKTRIASPKKTKNDSNRKGRRK